MVNYSKRKTLKIISGVGLASATSLLGKTALSNSPESKFADNKHTSALVPGTFKIEIITSSAVPEDTVIFSNHSDADITISNFLPGVITQRDQMIDLNTLLLKGKLHLKRGYPLATTAAKWKPLSLKSTYSYLWCDSAVSRLRDSSTGIITLRAFVNDGKALLTAVHEDLILS